jgi:hypothetical protein
MAPRSDGLLLAGIYHLLCGLFSLIGLCIVATAGAGLVFMTLPGDYTSDSIGAAVLAFITMLAAGFLLVVAAANLIVGWGLLRRHEWARIGALIMALFRLPNIPLGTVAGGLIIWYLVQPDTRAQFSHQAPDEVGAP